MKTQYYTATSLDGFIATRDHSLDWLFQFGDGPEGDYPEFIANVGALAMGSSTYEWVLRNHIYKDPTKPEPWMYDQPTWVFSSRELPKVPNADVRFVRGDVRPIHEEMRKVAAAAGDKNIWLVGGGELVGQFYDHGLLDEILASIASVTLGSGMPLLPRAIVTPPLKLVSAQAYKTSFALLKYEVVKQ